MEKLQFKKTKILKNHYSNIEEYNIYVYEWGMQICLK